MKSRQVIRAEARASAKINASYDKRLARRQAGRDLRERQQIRSANGFYTSSVFSVMTGSRSTPVDKRKIRKHKAFGRILYSQVIDGVEISYHATKGWRRHVA